MSQSGNLKEESSSGVGKSPAEPGKGILHRAGRSPAGLWGQFGLRPDSIVPPFPVRRLLGNWHWRICRSHSVQHTGNRPRGSARSGSRQCRQTYQSIGSVCIISFLQRRKKAENILIDAPGLRRCLCDLDLAALQFLTDRLTHSLQQFPLISVFTDHPAHGASALTCRNIHQRPPRLPLDGRGHGEGQVQPLLVTAHAFSTFALSDAHIPWHLSKRHPV